MTFKHALGSLIATGAVWAITVAGGSATADAAVVLYTSAAQFNAATTSPGVDTFSGLSVTASTPSPTLRAAGAYSYIATAETSTFFGAGTTADPWLSTNRANDR